MTFDQKIAANFENLLRTANTLLGLVCDFLATLLSPVSQPSVQRSANPICFRGGRLATPKAINPGPQGERTRVIVYGSTRRANIQ